MMRDRSIVKLPNIEGATADVRVFEPGKIANYLGGKKEGQILPIFHTLDVPRPITSILIGACLTKSEMGMRMLVQRANINLVDSQSTEDELEAYMEEDPNDLPVEGDPLDKIEVDLIRSDCGVNLTSVTVLGGNEVLPKKELFLFISQTFGCALTIARNHQQLRGGGQGNVVDFGSFTAEPPKF